ncbi:hypothetical protein F6B41_03015 [Microbacterium lushaniae]|nr:hypothetical protein F6B41_15660 [Microbacterium lushaniae]KAA9158662.1 hypothetical protein F6B41_03015 [Microbacterium lushaniae]
MDHPQSEDPQRPDANRVVVTVTRTGGIAGRRRLWRAEPPPDDTARWEELLERCPWDEVAAGGAGGDRFVWAIRAVDDRTREAELADARLQGPWRELVDAVRAAAS